MIRPVPKKNFPLRAFRDLRNFGRPTQKAINHIQMARRNKRIKITLAPIKGV